METQNEMLLELVYNLGIVKLSNRFSKGLLDEELHLMNESALRLYMYINVTLSYSTKGYIESQTIILEPNIKGFGRNGFFNACKVLVSKGILVKLKPKVYLVNPVFINRMTHSQVEMFNSDLKELRLSKHFGL